MYLWLVLSTFLAILAGYSLPLRSDMGERRDVSIAAAHIYRMIVNHKIALWYVRTKRWPYYCGSASVSDGVVLEECDYSDRVGYSKGIITEGMVEAFKPQDFIFDEENYISRIFCYNENGSEASDCVYEEGNKKKKYLVTYGDLHEKWLSSGDWSSAGGSRIIVTPREYLLKGLGEHFADDAIAGYIREDATGAHVINSWGMDVFTFLPAMWNEIFNSGKCNKDFNGSCLIYVNVL